MIPIVDRYNSGEMVTEMNIFEVDFESISAQIIKQYSSILLEEKA